MRPELVPERLLPQIGELIARTMGLHFPAERRMDLLRGLEGAATEFGFENATACAEWLLRTQLSPSQLHSLAGHLTIGETYFFRERRTFDALESRVLPDLLRRRAAERRLRIWSAACATGEEPYSLAILLRQLVPDWEQWRITILATDINQRFLQKAAAGVYGDWSFRDTSVDFRDRYFSRTPEGRYAIVPEIRGAVNFTQLNLVQDGFPSLATDTNGMDLIFCRNVLIYFTQSHTRALIEKLRQSLAPEGWLAVSPSECSHTLFAKFATENFPGAILYRKGEPAATESPLLSFVPAVSEEPTPHAASTAWQAPAEQYGEAEAAASPLPQPKVVVAELPDSNPESAPKLAAAARALANEGRLTEARSASERWIAAEKLEPASHYLHAMILQELGERGASRRSLQKALYLSPDFALAHFALGNLARDEGRSAEAGKHFRNALGLLRNMTPGAQIPESEGLTAGRLTEIIDTVLALPRSAA